MDKEKIIEALKKLRESSTKRNFKQSIDASIILKEFDLSNPNNKVEILITLPKGLGKEIKTLALVDKDVVVEARNIFDKVVVKDDFSSYKGDKKKIKQLIKGYDYIIAESTVMTDVAATFGKVLGSKGVMPNPKAGTVFPPKADMKALLSKLKNSVFVRNKKQAAVSFSIGLEAMSDEDLANNLLHAYEEIKKALPRGDQQIKKVIIKMTMSKPVVVGA